MVGPCENSMHARRRVKRSLSEFDRWVGQGRWRSFEDVEEL